MPPDDALAGALLERLAQPALVVDEALQVRCLNGAARGVVARGDVFRLVGGRLAATVVRVEQELRRALRALAAGGGAASLVQMPVTGQVAPLSLYLLPLGVPHRDAVRTTDILAVIHHPAARTTVDPRLLARAFALTVAQSRVAAALATGDAPKTIARALGVSEATVRKHVQVVFRQLGVERMPELVALIGRFPVRHVRGRRRVTRSAGFSARLRGPP